MRNEINLYDAIGGEKANAANVLPQVQAADPEKPIVLNIHSPGGSVLEGEAILSALRGHPAGFEANIQGMAFSMAANIALSASYVRMPKDGWLMFHFSRSSEGGTAYDLERQKRVLETMDESLLDKIEAKLGKYNPGREVLDKRLANEWWVDGKEALSIGLADELTDEVALAACAYENAKTAPDDCLKYLDKLPKNLDPTNQHYRTDEKVVFLTWH